jgi:hypothetical protein
VRLWSYRLMDLATDGVVPFGMDIALLLLEGEMIESI